MIFSTILWNVEVFFFTDSSNILVYPGSHLQPANIVIGAGVHNKIYVYKNVSNYCMYSIGSAD